MQTISEPITSAALMAALEGRDGSRLAGFYADDAVIQLVDHEHPPSHPREIRGRSAIKAFWDDICGREMTHHVEDCVEQGNRMALTEACAYPDGNRVLAMSVLELKKDRIARHTAVQAWDE